MGERSTLTRVLRRVAESYYADTWRWIASRRPFPGHCRCGVRHDNSAGLSWTVMVPARGSATRSHYTSFSAQGVVGTPRSEDRTPPQVLFTGLPDTCVDEDFPLRVDVFDANPLRRVRVLLDGRRLLAGPTTSGFLRFRVPAVQLRPGVHAISVAAVDARGNGRTKTRTFRRCRAPSYTG